MKLFKWGLLPALSMVLFACSDSSSSSDSGANPPDTEIELSSCQAIDDENLNARVVQANAQVFEAIDAAGKSDFESLQAEIRFRRSAFPISEQLRCAIRAWRRFAWKCRERSAGRFRL